MDELKPIGGLDVYISDVLGITTTDTEVLKYVADRKVRIMEIAILGDANMSANGKLAIFVKGKPIMRGTTGFCSLLSNLSGISIDLKNSKFFMDRADAISVRAYTSAGAASLQVQITGELLDE